MRGGQLHRRPLAGGVEGGGFAGLRGGQLDPRGQLQPLNPLNPAAADVAPGVSGVEGAG